MSDIVERLRARAGNAQCLWQEAADEIERLRALSCGDLVCEHCHERVDPDNEFVVDDEGAVLHERCWQP